VDRYSRDAGQIKLGVVIAKTPAANVELPGGLMLRHNRSESVRLVAKAIADKSAKAMRTHFIRSTAWVSRLSSYRIFVDPV
jgi:hypothetical protein